MLKLDLKRLLELTFFLELRLQSIAVSLSFLQLQLHHLALELHALQLNLQRLNRSLLALGCCEHVVWQFLHALGVKVVQLLVVRPTIKDVVVVNLQGAIFHHHITLVLLRVQGLNDFLDLVDFLLLEEARRLLDRRRWQLLVICLLDLEKHPF